MYINKMIFFYKADEIPYGAFSNFAEFPVRIQDKIWPSSEHYFQAMKFQGTEHEEELRQLKNPMDVALAGRDRSRPLRSDWEFVKDDVMRTAVFAKFSQYDFLKQLLLSTNNETIVEHSSNDHYWADGSDGIEIGTGKNMLGIILMEVRQKLSDPQI